MCHAIHYGFCTVVALPPGVILRGDEDITEKRKSAELIPAWWNEEPKVVEKNVPDIAPKAEPTRAELKVVNFPELALSNLLPDLVTSNDVTEIERKKSAAKKSANDLANNNIVQVDAPVAPCPQETCEH